MADSYQRGQRGTGRALAKNMMGRNSQPQGAAVGVQQVVVLGFNDSLLVGINKNLQAIYAMLADGLKKDKKDLVDKKKAAVQAKGQVRKKEETKGLGSAIGGGIKKIGNIAKEVTNFGGILDGLINGFIAILGGWLAGKLPEIIDKLKKAWEKVGPTITKIFNVLWKAIKWTFNFIVKTVRAIVDFLKKGFEFVGGIIKKFIDFVTGIAEKVMNTIKKVVDFVQNVKKKISNTFGAIAGFLGFGDSEDKTEKVTSVSSGRKNRRNKRRNKKGKGETYDKWRANYDASDTSINGLKEGDEGFEEALKKSWLKEQERQKKGKSANITNKNNVVGDMKGTGTKFKANLIAGQPVGDKLTEDQMKMIGISKRMSESNYMNFSPKVRAMYEEQISGVTPTGKVQGITKDKTFVQEKPKSQATFVIPPLPVANAGGMGGPSGPNPRPSSSGSTASKSIPSSNPSNFYTLFSAIQYNCTAHF